MTVVQLGTRSASDWAVVEDVLTDSLIVADHPIMNSHAATADCLLRDSGAPTQVWADRIAAIAVIAARRADVAPTMVRRVAYLDVYEAACDLLQLADDVHDIRPCAQARALLTDLSAPRPAAVEG